MVCVSKDEFKNLGYLFNGPYKPPIPTYPFI